MERLQTARVAVAGCGGLGGYIIEMLARIGVGHLTVVDGDVFEESNLNRQLLSETRLLNTSKAEAAKCRIFAINPDVCVTAHHQWLTSDNIQQFLVNHDVIVDALDSISIRMLLQDAAEKLGTPLIHGAIGGWYGQVTVIFPYDRTLNKLYRQSGLTGVEKRLGNPSFTPALVASIQAAETIKLLVGRGELLRNKVLRIDLLDSEFTIID